ncbi:MAG: hypothetical protein GY832_05830 [Chloroflexi bacterium]|nr:hypothetical protein [Chloroflexota bacterium]
MNVRQLAVSVTMAIAILSLSACAEWENYTPSAADLTRITEEIPPGPTRDMIQGTAIARYVAAAEAEETITAAHAAESAARAELEHHTVALTAEAQSTITARENAAYATTQALDARATTQALDVLATAQAQSAQATTTAESRDATATATAAIAQATATAEEKAVRATAEMATATMQAATDSVEKTRQASQAVILEATANAVKRQDEMDEAVQGVRTVAPWVGLVTTVSIILGLILYFAPVIKARTSIVPRKNDVAELYFVTTSQIAAMARLFNPLLDLITQSTPQLAPLELQDRTNARAQLANVIRAARGTSRQMAKRRTQAPGIITPSAIRVVEPNTIRPWIEDARSQLIEQEMSDGNI